MNTCLKLKITTLIAVFTILFGITLIITIKQDENMMNRIREYETVRQGGSKFEENLQVKSIVLFLHIFIYIKTIGIIIYLYFAKRKTSNSYIREELDIATAV